MQLAVADVDRCDPRRSPLQQDVGESAGRRADVEGFAFGNGDLEGVERVPNFVSYGYLKLQPIWDPLRGDPRFEKIVASLAPKN